MNIPLPALPAAAKPAPRGLRPIDLTAAVVLLGILYASLVRGIRMDCSRFASTVLRESQLVSGTDVFGNLLAYALLAACLALSWQQRRAAQANAPRSSHLTGLWVVLACVGLSILMEAAQACLPHRTSSAVDVLSNGAGAAFGWTLTTWLGPGLSRLFARWGDPGTLTVLMVAGACYALSHYAVWLPRLDLAAITGNLREIQAALDSAPWRVSRLLRYGLQFLALGLSFALPIKSVGARLVAIAAALFVALPLSLIVPNPQVPAEAWVSIPVAAVAAGVLATSANRSVLAVIVVVAALTAVAIYELQAAAGTAQAFHWSVLALQGNPVTGVRITALYAWFTLTVMVAGTTLIPRPLLWELLAVAVLALLEVLQTTVPGRIPDLSAPVTALAAAAFAWGLMPRRNTQRVGSSPRSA